MSTQIVEGVNIITCFITVIKLELSNIYLKILTIILVMRKQIRNN